MSLTRQGIRSIEGCPEVGANGSGRYLVIGGPANGGPLEKETVGERFSLYASDGASAPVRLIEDLDSYTVRPEGLALITVAGQARILFVEDRFQSGGYATRNALHWPLSILGRIP